MGIGIGNTTGGVALSQYRQKAHSSGVDEDYDSCTLNLQPMPRSAADYVNQFYKIKSKVSTGVSPRHED